MTDKTAARHALEELQDLAAELAGVAPVDQAEAAEASALLAVAVEALDAALSSAHPADIAQLMTAANEIAVLLAAYEPEDLPSATAAAVRLTARNFSRRLTRQGPPWGTLLWTMDQTARWMRSRMTEDELWDHDLCCPWPDLDRIEAAITVAVDGGGPAGAE